MAPRSGIALCSALLCESKVGFSHFESIRQRPQVVLGSGKAEELHRLLPESLSGLRHVDVAVLPEEERMALEGVAEEGGGIMSFSYPPDLEE